MVLRFTRSRRQAERRDSQNGTATSTTRTPSTSSIKGRARTTLVVLSIVGGAIGAAVAPAGAGSPSAPLLSGFRPFTSASYWNTPLPSGAPVSSSSAKYIYNIRGMSNTTYPVIAGTGGTWAKPIWSARSTAKRYVIRHCGASYPLPPKMTNPGVRIPRGARPDPTADGEMVVFDRTDGTVYGLWQAHYNRTRDSWCAGGGDFWKTTTNGLHAALPQSNCSVCMGHRGLASAALVVRYDEVASGMVNHVVRMAIPHTAARHVFPMTGDEHGAGMIPEGTRIRIRPSVNLAGLGLSRGALAIARGLQKYGAVIGDQSGSTFTLSVENLAVENQVMGTSRHWSALGVSARSLSRIPIRYFQVIQLGYGA
jgi:hypothetical protein